MELDRLAKISNANLVARRERLKRRRRGMRIGS